MTCPECSAEMDVKRYEVPALREAFRYEEKTMTLAELLVRWKAEDARMDRQIEIDQGGFDQVSKRIHIEQLRLLRERTKQLELLAPAQAQLSSQQVKAQAIGGGCPPVFEDDSIRSWGCGCYEDQGGYHLCSMHLRVPAPPAQAQEWQPIVECVICRWPVENDDCYVCPCCGHEPICDEGTYKWGGQWWSQARTKPLILENLEAALPPAHGWQPISTAPKDRLVWFWLMPKTADETYCDTAGKPILATVAPFASRTFHGHWGSLIKATHWHKDTMPDPPTAHGWHAEKEKLE